MTILKYYYITNISKNFNNLSNVKTTLTSLAKSLVSSVGN